MAQVYTPVLHSCILCKELIYAYELHPIFNGPVCSGCLFRHSYNAANERYAGIPDGLPMFSVEFEVLSGERSAEHALVLLKHNFLRTSDISVSDEYKSPRYLSQRAFTDILPTLENLKDLVRPGCGTHIHVDCPAKAIVHSNDWTLFGPLLEYLEEYKEQTRYFWGRWPYDFIRTDGRYQTIEFRLPRFRNAEQYLRVVQFCRMIGCYLDLHLNKNHPSYEPLSLDQLGQDILAFYRLTTSLSDPVSV